MDIPIEGLLSGRRLDVARLQDAVVGLIYNYVQPNAILYGGTAVWRCYDGGRFSEDIDLYVNKHFSKSLEETLNRNNFGITWRNKDLPSNVRISDGKTEILLEAKIGRFASDMSQYTKTDGSSITISTLEPSELFVRKIEAYEGRRYIRDLYDLMHLTNYVKNSDYYVIRKFKPFIANIKKPVDEHLLRSLIYKGDKGLDFDSMVKYLKRWAGVI